MERIVERYENGTGLIYDEGHYYVRQLIEAEEAEGEWVTVGGRRIFIGKGEDKQAAIDKAMGGEIKGGDLDKKTTGNPDKDLKSGVPSPEKGNFSEEAASEGQEELAIYKSKEGTQISIYTPENWGKGVYVTDSKEGNLRASATISLNKVEKIFKDRYGVELDKKMVREWRDAQAMEGGGE